MANSPITRAAVEAKPLPFRSPRKKGSVLAEYPCDMHLARYAGPSTRVYLNAYRDETEAKFKCSVCPECLALLMTEWLARALVQSPDGYWNPPEDGTDLEAIFRPRSAPPRPLRRTG